MVKSTDFHSSSSENWADVGLVRLIQAIQTLIRDKWSEPIDNQ